MRRRKRNRWGWIQQAPHPKMGVHNDHYIPMCLYFGTIGNWNGDRYEQARWPSNRDRWARLVEILS